MSLITSIDYASTKGLDLGAVLDSVSLPVHREPLVAQVSQTRSQKLSVLKEDNSFLGIVADSRPELSHREAVTWLVEQLNQSQVPWKIRTSVLDEKTYDVYQEYVFDRDVTTPDGSIMNPMFILRLSHVRAPFQLIGGTLRHACSNGAIVGNITGKVKLSPKDISHFARFSATAQIREMINRYDRVGEFYSSLGKSSAESVKLIFADKRLPFGMKKSVLASLEGLGQIELNTGVEPKEGKLVSSTLDRDFFQPAGVQAGLSISADLSAWNLYNNLTYWATNFPKSDSSRMTAYRAIDNVFTTKPVYTQEASA